MDTYSLTTSASPLCYLSPPYELLSPTSSEPQQFLKLEDLHASSSSPPPMADKPAAATMATVTTTTTPHASPPTVIVQSKPAKKRKSWGQELPEPKTSLPPRKRAKTEDEKEQRRIERIKRNRAAAHNSRERKRQETDTLAVALARANAELDAYRRLHGPLPANIVLPEVTLSTDAVSTPAPSLIESNSSTESMPSPPSPLDREDSLFEGDIVVKKEAADATFGSLTPCLDALDAKSSPAPLLPLDLTQHSAVSVEPPKSQRTSFASSLSPGFTSLPLDQDHSQSLDSPIAGLLSDHSLSALDAFTLPDDALDPASFHHSSVVPLDFSFDDLINDTATAVVVD